MADVRQQPPGYAFRSRINRTLENFTLALLRERRYVAPSRRRKEEEEVRDIVYV